MELHHVQSSVYVGCFQLMMLSHNNFFSSSNRCLFFKHEVQTVEGKVLWVQSEDQVLDQAVWSGAILILLSWHSFYIPKFSSSSQSEGPKAGLKILLLGFPRWRSGWESACQCREHGFEPWSGKIPHAAEQLGPWATVTEPARLEPVLRNKRGRDSERPVHRNEERPQLVATRESPRTETKTQHSYK